MAFFPPHAWQGRYNGYQPPDDFFDPALPFGGPFGGGGLRGIPGFMEAAPPFGFDGAPPDFLDGPPGFHPPPPPFLPDDGDDEGPGLPPGFFGGRRHGGFHDPRFWGPWGGDGPGRRRGGRGWHFGGDEDEDEMPSVTGRRGGRGGVGMIYNPKQARLHIFKKNDVEPWKEGTKKAVMVKNPGAFNIWDADVNWTVKQLLEYLGKGDDKWAVTEVTEAGSGKWYKGSTIKPKTDRAAETLAKQGWTERRGQGFGQVPVWLVIHKAEEEK